MISPSSGAPARLVRAVLDTCVLFPAALRDVLLTAAQAKRYAAHWSDTTLEELARNLVLKGRTAEEPATRLVQTMERAFPDATVRECERLIPCLTNDEKDRHVVAAALIAHAEAIVTYNLDDFSDRDLAPLRLEAQNPDSFLLDLYREDGAPLLLVLATQSARLSRPPLGVADILDRLERHIPQTVALARRASATPGAES